MFFKFFVWISTHVLLFQPKAQGGRAVPGACEGPEDGRVLNGRGDGSAGPLGGRGPGGLSAGGRGGSDCNGVSDSRVDPPTEAGSLLRGEATAMEPPAVPLAPMSMPGSSEVPPGPSMEGSGHAEVPPTDVPLASAGDVSVASGSPVIVILDSPTSDQGKGAAGDETGPSDRPEVPVVEQADLEPGEASMAFAPIAGDPNTWGGVHVLRGGTVPPRGADPCLPSMTGRRCGSGRSSRALAKWWRRRSKRRRLPLARKWRRSPR